MTNMFARDIVALAICFEGGGIMAEPDIGFGPCRSTARLHRVRCRTTTRASEAVAEPLAYTADELTSIQRGEHGPVFGHPTATAHIKQGDGGGRSRLRRRLDSFLASKIGGPEGRAIGIVLWTPAMIEPARAPTPRQAVTPMCRFSTVATMTGFRCRTLRWIASSPTGDRIGAGQASGPPRNCPRPQARRPGGRERHRLEQRAFRGRGAEHRRLRWLALLEHPDRRLPSGAACAVSSTLRLWI